MIRKSVLNFRSLQKGILGLKEDSIQRERILKNIIEKFDEKITCRLSTDERMKLMCSAKYQAVGNSRIKAELVVCFETKANEISVPVQGGEFILCYSNCKKENFVT